MKNFSVKNKKVFVLGGSGLIGQSIVENFKNNGATVINFDIKKLQEVSIKLKSIDPKEVSAGKCNMAC